MAANADGPIFLRPGPIGRSVRVLLGVASLLLSALVLLSFRGYLRIGVPGGPWWLLAGISLYALPHVIDIGFGRSFKARSQGVALVLIVAAAALDLIVYRNVWGPPLGAILYGLTVVVLGYMGFSFLLGGIVAVPGCEMRAVPYLLAQLSGGESEQHY